MSGQKKLFNRHVKIIYKDVANIESDPTNPRPIITRYENVTPVDADGEGRSDTATERIFL